VSIVTILLLHALAMKNSEESSVELCRSSPTVISKPLAPDGSTMRAAAVPSPPTRQAPPDDSQRLLARLPVVIEVTGLGRSTIYRWIADGSFPPPVRLGPRAVAWRCSGLDHWTQSRALQATESRAARRVKGGRSPASANP
jgi:prophage regulatory protein